MPKLKETSRHALLSTTDCDPPSQETLVESRSEAQDVSLAVDSLTFSSHTLASPLRYVCESESPSPRSLTIAVCLSHYPCNDSALFHPTIRTQTSRYHTGNAEALALILERTHC